MPDLKLARLPDRTPIKLMISVSPDLHRALTDYAIIYEHTYSDAQAVVELVPHMLTSFLAGDRGFAKAREALTEKQK